MVRIIESEEREKIGLGRMLDILEDNRDKIFSLSVFEKSGDEIRFQDRPYVGGNSFTEDLTRKNISYNELMSVLNGDSEFGKSILPSRNASNIEYRPNGRYYKLYYRVSPSNNGYLRHKFEVSINF